MPDIGERYTEASYNALRRRLRQVYSDAQRDVAMKLSSFEHAHRERVKKHLAEVREGKITQEDFKAWMRGQVFQREQWQKKQQQVAEIMAHVDEQAMAMLNDGKVDVFAENANFMGWQLESGAGTDFGFGLYNRDAVTQLIKEDPDLLPRPGIDKEKSYAWYNQIVSDAVTQGILQGEALDDIMLRIANDTGERSINAMLRNARTAYTGAQNAGREMAIRRVKAKGIRVHKQWSAMMNAATRDAHAELNGKHVDPDEPFKSMLGDIMRPGDPKAKPANVYNCHCCLKKYFLDYPDSSGVRGGNGEDTDENREAYERWKALKKAAGKATTQDIRKQLKKRAEEKKKAQTPAKADPLAGATWANGPRAGQKYGEETGKALTKGAENGSIQLNAEHWKTATFQNEKKLKRHIANHLKEFGDISEQDYIDGARKLLSSEITGDVEGFVGRDGFVFRYNTSTNELAIGHPGGSISTYLKPLKGREYWNEQIEKYKPEA